MSLVSFEEKLKKTLDFFKEEIRTLRTGRANPALVEDIKVDYYGNPTPLKQLASINVPEPRMIVVSPYDKSVLVLAEKAVSESELNLSVTNDGNIIRIAIPPLNEERRNELIKIVAQKAEDAKVAMRNSRREEVESIDKDQKNGLISEDDKFKQEKEVQAKLDEYIKLLDELVSFKEQEIKEVWWLILSKEEEQGL